jgi:hypothetical protein
MPRRCSGAFDAEALRKIKDDFTKGHIPTGTCAICGRKNVTARLKGDKWLADSHGAVQPEKGTGKRMSK